MRWKDSTDQNMLRVVVKRLKHDVEAAYYQCQDDLASDLHDDLVAAEWRLRMAERKG